jgi:hypothetical protein
MKRKASVALSREQTTIRVVIMVINQIQLLSLHGLTTCLRCPAAIFSLSARRLLRGGKLWSNLWSAALIPGSIAGPVMSGLCTRSTRTPKPTPRRDLGSASPNLAGRVSAIGRIITARTVEFLDAMLSRESPEPRQRGWQFLQSHEGGLRFINFS